MTHSKPPLVSIGVPVYNCEKYIRQSLRSIINQTYKHVEIIVSDNCSTDNTWSICQDFAKKNKRIRVFRQEKNRGPADNFNFVLQKAKGKFFLWTAGDDIRDAHCIKKMVDVLNNNPACVLTISAVRQFSQSGEHNEYPLFPRHSHPIQTVRIFLHHPEYSSFIVYGMYRTDILKQSGGFHKDRRTVFGGSSEFITAYRILLQGDLVYIHKLLLHKRDSGFYLSKYKVLQSGNVPTEFIKNIWRFLQFPSIFFFDLYYGLLHTARSALPLHQKLVVCSYCFDNYIIEHVQFLSTIIHGTYFFLRGFFNRFFYIRFSIK